ncbi:MAG TPA: hypothetical protein VFG03_00090 [Telluria sp.]|nr:hypothetical protein [Telluria sp.]
MRSARSGGGASRTTTTAALEGTVTLPSEPASMAAISNFFIMMELLGKVVVFPL